MCYKEVYLSPKIKVLPSGTLSQTADFSPRQVDRVVNKTRRRSSLLTTPTRQSTSRGCLLQVDLPRFVMDVQFVSEVNKILTDIARCAVRLLQQSFFFSLFLFRIVRSTVPETPKTT